MIWAALKRDLRKINQSPTLSGEVVNNIRTVISRINTSNIWRNCVTHAQEKEKEYSTLPPVQPIVIKPADDSSSDESDDYIP